MKLLRTIRLDPSDTFIFPTAAEPGDWAISGAFLFAEMDLDRLEGKLLAAFRSGFLGVPSLGSSTLAQVVEAAAAERSAAVEQAARCFHERLGAPDLAAGREAAEAEFAFAASLCDHPAGTLIAVRRHSDAGTIREAFRSLRARPGAARNGVYSFLAADEEEEAGDAVDLRSLARENGQ